MKMINFDYRRVSRVSRVSSELPAKTPTGYRVKALSGMDLKQIVSRVSSKK